MIYRNDLRIIFRDHQIGSAQIVGYLSGLSKIATMFIIASSSTKWTVKVIIGDSNNGVYPFILETSLPPEWIIYKIDSPDQEHIQIRLEQDIDTLLSTVSFSKINSIDTVDLWGGCKNWTLKEFFLNRPNKNVEDRGGKDRGRIVLG